MADSDEHWRRWSESEPYFGVLADTRFRMASIEASRDEFFELGRLVVEDQLATAERCFGPYERRRALDFGCGVGRLTLPLARRFDETVGLDIAPAMLAEARRNADAEGIGNLHLALSDDDLSAAAGLFDFVISSLVLQHIPARRGLPIIARLLERVAPGGVASLQFCIDRHDDAASRLRYWAQCHVPGMHQLFNIARGRPWREPFMQMNAYPFDAVLALIAAADFDIGQIDRIAHGRFMTAQLIMRRREQTDAR